MDSVKFDENTKKYDGSSAVKKTRKPKIVLSSLTDEERLRRSIDLAQARRDYVKQYYRQNEEYRAACKLRSKVFAKNYYHTNENYRERVLERSTLISRLKYLIFKERDVEDVED